MISVTTLAIVIIGCTTAKVTPADPATGTPATTNYIVDPKLTKAIEVASQVNDATAAVDPYSGYVKWGLGAASLVAGWFAKRKNDQLAAQVALSKAMVQAVDQYDNQAVKDAIQVHATRVGVEGELNTFVKQVGSGTV